MCIVVLLAVYAIAVTIYSKHSKSPYYISGAPYHQNVECAPWPMRRPHERIHVLALKGGGVHGLIELAALQYLEAKTGKATYELFDVISGTSTGAIIAVGLATPDKKGRPRFSAAELYAYYQQMGPELLSAPPLPQDPDP